METGYILKKDISDCLTKHFQHISTTVSPTIDENLIGLIPTCINNSENALLETIPFYTEIKNILFNMEPNKSPGPDGFPPSFFQRNWETISSDLVQMIQTFFSHAERD